MLKNGELISTVQLNQGTIELDQDQDDEEERLVIPLKSSPELHLGNLDSGIEVIMSGESEISTLANTVLLEQKSTSTAMLISQFLSRSTLSVSVAQ